MDFKELDVLTLDDDREYVIADIIDYKKKKYAYLVDIHNKGNIMYAELKSNDLLTAIGSDNHELIKELSKIIAIDADIVKNNILNYKIEE